MTHTRVHPLPVRMDEAEGHFMVLVDGDPVASAWGPAVDDPDTWFHWNGFSNPYRISGGRDGAAALLADRLVQWQRREGSLWHPDHGALDDAGHVAVAPFGVVCIGCGDLLDGRAFVATEGRTTDVDQTVHYVCDSCDAFNEQEMDRRG
jgi:hypothetical protein